MTRWTTPFAFLLTLVLVGSLQGQEERTIRGRVLLFDTPLDSGRVVLHRVATETGGNAIDSVEVRGGDFSFVLPESILDVTAEDVYLVAVRHAGILYFSNMIASAEDLEREVTLRVFDTEVADPNASPVLVRDRMMLLSPLEDGSIQVTDFFAISQQGRRTLVPVEGEDVWRHPIPEGARNATVDGLDLPDGVTVADGMVHVTAPIPPAAGADSSRTIVVQYTIPSIELAVPFTAPTNFFRLMLDQDLPRVEAPALQFGGSTALDLTQNVDVYLASNLENVVLQIREVIPPFEVPGAWLLSALALLLVGVGVYVVRRGDAEPALVAAGSTEALLLETALLDEGFECGSDPAEAEVERYRLRRAELIRRLTDLSTR